MKSSKLGKSTNVLFKWLVLGSVLLPGGLYPIHAIAEIAEPQSQTDSALILELHKNLLQSHLKNDAQGVLAAEPGQIVVVSRGEVQFFSKEERLAHYQGYLADVEFSEYRDLIEPIVRISQDGTLGWLIAQVKIAGNQLDRQSDKKAFDSVWAWIELYEKRDGRWFRVGEVSNAKPPRDPSPRWKQIVEPSPGRFAHHLELFSGEQVDGRVRAWLQEAWAAAGRAEAGGRAESKK